LAGPCWRNIEAERRRELFDREAALFALVVKRRIAVALAVAGLCAAVAGCVSDMGAPTTEDSSAKQLRYYGGPKYPMWSGQ
jgi:hypothetical protein